MWPSSVFALGALNLFMADVRDGLGPFLGIFLQQKGWEPASIGLVMTLGGLAGMVATTPLGMLVDSTARKRGLLGLATVILVIACGINIVAPVPWAVGLAQVLSGIAAAAVGPAIAALTLGLVGPAGYPRQLGRNEALNHAGNAMAAAMAGLLGWFYGLPAVFGLMAALAGLSLVALAGIRHADIDQDAARGAAAGAAPEGSGWRMLLQSAPLRVLGLTCLLFHLGNAAMLPLLGQAMAARGVAGDPAVYTAATVIIAQVSMVGTALLAAWLAARDGFRLPFILALSALVLRGLIAGLVQDAWVLVPVQILDGVGAGMLGVAVPGLAAQLLRGTGHATAGLAGVLTMQAIGASLSTTLGGVVAEYAGYPAAFLTLGGVAVAALALWCLAFPAASAARSPA